MPEVEVATTTATDTAASEPAAARTAAPEPTVSPAAGRYLALVFIAIGAALRLYQYLWDRSLWVDEAALANIVIGRGFGELAGALPDNQAAPLGFLYVERLAVLLGGPGELTLRLFPFLASLAALLLFWVVARRLLSPAGALVGLALFAVGPRVIYYAAEVKQYSSDVAIALALLALFLAVREQGLTRRSAVWLGAAGAAGLWFSQTAVFYLAAMGLALAVEQRHALRAKLPQLAMVAVPWLASFAAMHMLARRMVAGHRDFLEQWWGAGFLPLPPTSAADLVTWGSAFLRLFRDPLGFMVPALAAMAFVAGVGWLVRRGRAADALLLAAPLLLTMLAAGLRLYPFGDAINHAGRVLLFLVPVVLLLVAHGVAETARAVRVSTPMLGVALLVPFLLLRLEPALLVPLYRGAPASVQWVFIPTLPRFDIDSQPVGQVLARVAQVREAGDRFYVYSVANPTFEYYADRLGIPRTSYVRGSAEGTHLGEVVADLEPLRGVPRVWIFFAYAPGDIPGVFIRELNRHGTVVAVIEDGPVGALLYEMHR